MDLAKKSLIIVCFLLLTVGLFYLLINYMNTSAIRDISTKLSTTPTPTATAVPTVSANDFPELKAETLREGAGNAAKNGDTLEVNYLGTLVNGTKFDSSYDRNQTFSFKLGDNQVIQGWEQGMLGMKVGEKRKLSIPSSLGYGSTSQGSIPANAGLIFEVELISIK